MMDKKLLIIEEICVETWKKGNCDFLFHNLDCFWRKKKKCQNLSDIKFWRFSHNSELRHSSAKNENSVIKTHPPPCEFLSSAKYKKEKQKGFFKNVGKWKSMATINYLASNILQNIFFCI